MRKNKNHQKNHLALNQDRIRVLIGRELEIAQGAGIHGTGTETGLCPAHSVNCVKTR